MRSRVIGSNLFVVFGILLTAAIFLFPAATSWGVAPQLIWRNADPTPGTTNIWDTSNLNWWIGSGGNLLWTDGDDAVFALPGTTITVGNGIGVESMEFDNNNYILSGVDAITLKSLPVFTVGNAANVATINSVLSGVDATIGITKEGSGTLVLNGVNTYSGYTTVNHGTLQITNINALGAAAVGSTTLPPVTINAAGTLALRAASSGSGVALTYPAYTISGSGTLKIYGPNLVAATAVIPGNLSNFTGTIDINPYTLGRGGAGKTQFTGGQAFLPSASAVIKVENLTSLYYGTPVPTYMKIATPVQLLGTADDGENLGELRLDAVVQQGAVTLMANSTIGSANTAAVLSGSIGESGGSFGFTKQGGTTLSLTGVNTYTGTTSITGGTLQLGTGGATGNLGAGPVVDNTTLAFDRNNLITLSNSITGSGALIQRGPGTTVLSSAANAYTGATTATIGTLQIASKGTGAVTLGGTATINFQEAATGSSQSNGALLFSAGHGTLQSTYGGSGNTILTFSALSARSAGATGNFVVSGGTPTTNKIVLTGVTADTFMGQGYFFNNNNYAWYNAGGYVSGLDYTIATAEIISAAAVPTFTAGKLYEQISGAGQITAQTSQVITTLNIANSYPFVIADTNSLTLNGILLTGGNTSTISAGLTSGGVVAGSELVIRTDTSTDNLSISAPISGGQAVTKTGLGTLNLSGTNTYTGATTVNQGTLNLNGGIYTTATAPGAINIAGGATVNLNAGSIINTSNVGSGGRVTIGTTPFLPAILNISGGTINATSGSPSITMSSTGNAQSFVNMTSGTVTTSSEIHIGNSGGGLGLESYEAWTMSGGTLNAGSYIVVGGNYDRAVYNQSGGMATINNTGSLLTIGALGWGSMGVVNLSGGTFISNAGTGSGCRVGENAYGVLNVSGTGVMSLGGVGLNFGHADNDRGIANLLGGTIVTNRVTQDSVSAIRSGTVNFNGGTLKAGNTPIGATFFQGISNAYVYSGGGTIDNGNNSITIAQPLVAPTGKGLNANPTVTNGGAGYIDTPLVEIDNDPNDRTGFGATAVAVLGTGATAGQVVGITITNPGVNYTQPPTFKLWGGGATTNLATVASVTPTSNSSMPAGGMTFAGGTDTGVATTLTGVSTYGGQTTVSSGKLILGGAGSVNSSSGININGATATLVQNSSVAITPTVIVTNGTLDGTTTINTVIVPSATGGIISHGDGAAATPLTIGSLTFSGVGTMNLFPSPLSPFTPLVQTTDLYTGAAANSITINTTANYYNPGVYSLVGYTNIHNLGFNAFKLGTISGLNVIRGQTATITNSFGNIAMTIVGDNPVWNGQAGAGNFDWNTTVANTDWYLPSVPQATWYIQGDVVRFDDTAANTNVNISGASVSPTVAVFENNVTTYTVTSTNPLNGIAGTGKVIMTGTGTVNMNTLNTYSGGTVLSGAGTFNINNLGTALASSIGTGPLTISGNVTLDAPSGPITLLTNNTQSWNSDFSFSGTNNLNMGTGAVTIKIGSHTINTTNSGGTGVLTIAGNIGGGSGLGLNKSGPGTLELKGTNTYTGPTWIYNGTLTVSAGTTGTLGTNDTLPGAPNIAISPDASQGVGTLNVTGGVVNADRIIIGGQPSNGGTPGDAFMTMSGGTVNSNQWFTVGSGVGGGTVPLTGTFTMTGGTLNVLTTLIEVGNFGQTVGIVTMDNSLAPAAIRMYANTSIRLGSNNNSGSGTFTQNGGSVTFYSDNGTTIGGTGALNLGNGGTLPVSSTFTYNLNGGTLTVPTINRTAASATQLSSGIFNFGGGTLRAATANTTWMEGITQAKVLDGAIAYIDTNNLNATIAQPIVGDALNTGGLTKQGSGTLTLSGASTYGGTTTVTAGTLTMTGSLLGNGVTSGAISITGGSLVISGAGSVNLSTGININGATAKMVQNGSVPVTAPVALNLGTLDGTTTYDDTVTVGNNIGAIVTNGNGVAVPLAITNLTYTGLGTLSPKPVSTTVVGLNIGTLTTDLSGLGHIKVTASGPYWLNGTTYNLAHYNSLVANAVPASDFSVGTVPNLANRQNAVLVVDPAPGNIKLTFTGDVPFWTGAQSTNWTTTPIGSLWNWTVPSAPVNEFASGDQVLFDNRGAAVGGLVTVNISDANVQPSSVIFNNTDRDYTIVTGTGASAFGIVPWTGGGTAGGAIVLNGTRAVTLTTPNTYTLGTYLNSGTLNINNATAIGTGSLTITGGTLDTTVSAASLAVTNASAQLWNGDFTFTGTKALTFTNTAVLGGTGSTRTVTVTANTLTIASMPATAGNYSLTKLGTGNLALSSTTNGSTTISGTLDVEAGQFIVAADTTVNGLTSTSSSGTITLSGSNAKWFFVNCNTDSTYRGIINGGAAKEGLQKNGTGKLTLTNPLNVLNDANNVNAGTLVFQGTHLDTTATDNVATTAGRNGVLILSSGAVYNSNNPAGGLNYNASINISTNATSAGSMQMGTGVTFTTARQLTVGGTGYGAFTQTGGSSSIGGFIACGGSGTVGAVNEGVVNLSGGTLTMSQPDAPITLGYSNASSIAVMNVSGNAVLNVNGASGSGLWVAESGTAVLNVSGTAAINIPNDGIVMAKGFSTYVTPTATVNLLGGTTTVQSISKTQAGGTATLNFNGGTLKANVSNQTFLQGLNNTYIYANGGTIDSGVNDITVAQNLLAPPGSGVSASGLSVDPLSVGGYIDTPIVQISDGGAGVGATAVATIDYTTGKVTGIVITNPGVNYTAPSFTLLGGGVGASTTFIGALSTVVNTSGALHTAGSGLNGIVRLTGTNTYGSNTTYVDSGTLVAEFPASLPDNNVIVSNGATIAVNVGGVVGAVNEWTAVQANTLFTPGGATFNPGSFLGFDTTNATGPFTYGFVINGNMGLQKLGPNSLVLNTSDGYTGATVIRNGTLELASTGNINPASAISTAATTAIFQIDGGPHTVGTISGVGTTKVLGDGALTATSITQGTLTIGAGFAPAIPDGAPAGVGSVSPVPEPATWAMLLLAAMGLGIYRRRSR